MGITDEWALNDRGELLKAVSAALNTGQNFICIWFPTPGEAEIGMQTPEIRDIETALSALLDIHKNMVIQRVIREMFEELDNDPTS